MSLNDCRDSLLIVLSESRDDLAESRLFRLSELEEFSAERPFPDSLHRGPVDHEASQGPAHKCGAPRRGMAGSWRGLSINGFGSHRSYFPSDPVLTTTLLHNGDGKAKPSVGRCQERRLIRGMEELTDCGEQRSQGEWLGKKGEMGFVGESPAHHRAF